MLPLSSARGFCANGEFAIHCQGALQASSLAPLKRGVCGRGWLLTVSIFHPSVVAFLPKADVSQVEDPCHDLQHQLLILAPDADDLHGVLGVVGTLSAPARPQPPSGAPPPRELTMVSWKSLRSSVPSTWYVSDWFR